MRSAIRRRFETRPKSNHESSNSWKARSRLIVGFWTISIRQCNIFRKDAIRLFRLESWSWHLCYFQVFVFFVYCVASPASGRAQLHYFLLFATQYRAHTASSQHRAYSTSLWWRSAEGKHTWCVRKLKTYDRIWYDITMKSNIWYRIAWRRWLQAHSFQTH